MGVQVYDDPLEKQSYIERQAGLHHAIQLPSIALS